MALASILSGMPDLLQRTLTLHSPDQLGYCRECREASGVAAPWPCAAREVADEADYIQRGGLPGTLGGRHRNRV